MAEDNRLFATNSIFISLPSFGVNFDVWKTAWYNKSSSFWMSKVYNIWLQRYRDSKLKFVATVDFLSNTIVSAFQV